MGGGVEGSFWQPRVKSMKMKLLAGAMLAFLSMGMAANAAPSNEPPPTGPVILDLNGTPIPHSYTEYSVDFTTAPGQVSTNLSFAFREDPAFLFLDDVTLTTGGGPNLLTNGDFEAGPVGSSAPTGWTYLNTFGATFGGVVATNNPHTGSNNYYDGAVQAYDGITQNVATTGSTTYTVTFWLDDNSSLTTFSALSTNGDVTDTGGNGADLLVYAGNVPVRTVPEPAAWALMLLGVGAVGGAVRRRRLLVAA
jgi:hypothetical protein